MNLPTYAVCIRRLGCRIGGRTRRGPAEAGTVLLDTVLALTLFVAAAASAEDGFVSLFNGTDLDGWTPKITGYDLGQDPLNTFRVEDGVIKVCYDKYQIGRASCRERV